MLIKFNSLRIGEFTSIVSEDNRKQLFKGVSPKRRISLVKDSDHRLSIIMVSTKGDLQSVCDKSNGKKNSTTFCALDRINLNNRCVGM